MRIIIHHALAAATIFALVAPAPVRAACWETAEYEAARVRDLQTMLMVSALQCRRAMPEMPAAYNSFIGRVKSQLLEGEKHLLAHFAREGDKLAYDRFTTSLANRYAERAQDPVFCERAKRVLAADEASGGVLPVLVGLLNTKPNGVGDICPNKPRTSVIVVSPFAPLPVDGEAPIAEAPAAAAPTSPDSAPPQ